MQETTTDESRLTMGRRHSTKEERKFHVDTWKKSGLTMSEYCRQNNVALSNLSEWKRALSNKPAKFKPARIPPPAREITSQSINLIEVIVDQRIKIRLQQLSDASFLLNIIKGLMSCS